LPLSLAAEKVQVERSDGVLGTYKILKGRKLVNMCPDAIGEAAKIVEG